MKRRVIGLIFTVVAILGVFAATLVSSSRPVLGLDLQGGISIVLFPVKGSDLSALNTAVDVIRTRRVTMLLIPEEEAVGRQVQHLR